jgi:hypothetical protein
MVTADQIVCHLVGDYILQSDWQAMNKTKRLWVALLHAGIYSLPFLFLGPSFVGWLLIWLSHALIDHFSVAKYLCWAKNWIGLERPKPWAECRANGYSEDRPPFLTWWLYIIADNTLHLILNGIAFTYLGGS